MLASALCLVTLFSVAAAPSAVAQSNDDRIMKVTVALIYRSSGFITWPETAFESEDSEFRIGVYGNEELADELKDATKGLEVKGHPISVIEIAEIDDIEDLHVLYVNSKTMDDFRSMTKEEMSKFPVLTISDDSEFMKDGGVLRIFVQNNKPKLQLNVDAAQRQQLTISSQLLKLAEVVRDEDT